MAQEKHLLLCLSPPRLSTPLAANFGPGPEATAEGRSAGLGVCFERLAPPTSGQYWRRQRRGTQLDVEFALYASRRRLRAWPGGGGGGRRSWTGSLLSMPPAADFGPGLEEAAVGSAAGRIYFFLRLAPPTSGLVRRRRRGGRAAGRGVCFVRLSPPTPGLVRSRAWPGGGGGGTPCLGPKFAFLPFSTFTHRPLDARHR